MTSTDPAGPGPASPEVVTPGPLAGPDPVQVEADLTPELAPDLAHDHARRVVLEPAVPPEEMPPTAEPELRGRPYRLAPSPLGLTANVPTDHPGPTSNADHAGPATAETIGSGAVRSNTGRLTVVYDETCALCRRAREWLLGQTTFIPLELLAAGSDEAYRRYGSLPWLGEELVVVDEHGQAWIGPAAFLMAMWATHRYRHWSYRLSGPAFAPLAEQFFHRISTKRRRLGAILPLGSPECTYCARPGVRS